MQYENDRTRLSTMRLRCSAGLLALALPLLLCACEGSRFRWDWGTPPPGGGDPNAAGRTDARAPLPPTLERLRRAYPDLESGRFVSLADFESAGQVGLFRTVDAAGKEEDRPQPALSILRCRSETGAGSLKVILEDGDDRLLFDGQHSEQYALIRDWRPFALLLMSIYGPPSGATLEFGVHSGAPALLHWSRTLQIRPGWGLYRIDLDTVGESIDLADVRALSWRAPQSSGPVELYLDDVVVADNTRTLTPAEADPDDLRVFVRGQRLHVGVPGRFELALADGVMVSWRDPQSDNLADIGGLGPWPIPLPTEWASPAAPAIAYDDPQLFTGWGGAVAAAQRVVEATPFRAVIEGQWRFVAPGAAPDPNTDSPSHAWQYTIYSTGALYVRVESRAADGGWAGARVGYAIGLDGRRGFTRIVPPATSSGDAAPFVLATRAGSAKADLFWTWPHATPLSLQRELVSSDDRRLAILVGDLPTTRQVVTSHLLRVWPLDVDGAPEALSLAADYQNPVMLRPTAGEVRTDVAGDTDHDGYNEAQGCYELALAEGVLRFDFDPGNRLRYDPIFRVHGTSDRRCWVYARGRVVQPLGRDADGQLLFRLGHVVSAATSIEVHAAPASGPL